MSGPGAGDEAWVRELLACLDRPAMPHQVAASIDTALGASVVPPSPRTSGEPGADAQRQPGRERPRPAGGLVTTSHRRRHRSWLLGAGAAAAAAVGLFLMDPFDGQTPPGGLAAPPTSGVRGSGPVDPVASPHPETAATTANPSVVAKVLTASATSYTKDALAQQAAEVARTPPGGAQQTTAAASTGHWATVADLPAANTEGASACVAALPKGQEGPLLFIDRAEYEGQPALIVVRRNGQVLEVHVLRASCTVADPAVVEHARVVAP